MSLSVHRRPGDAIASKGGPIGAHEASTRRLHALAAGARATTSSCSSPPEGAESAPPSWHPLPPSLPKRRRVGTTVSASADAASVPASFKRTAARMTWPPERTPWRDLDGCGGALPSPKPRRGLTRKEEYLGWLGSLRSGSGLPPRRDAGAGTSTSTSPSASAPPSPMASSAARVPLPRRSGGINASASSNTVSLAPPTAASPKGRPHASAASPRGCSTPPHLSAQATASRGDRRPPPPPPTKQPAGTSSRSKTNRSTGSEGALPITADAPLPQTDRPPPPTADAPSPQTDRPPPPTAFGHSPIEVLLSLNFGHRGAPPPHQTKLTTGTPGGASLLQNNVTALALGAPAFPRLDALSQRIIEVLFDLNYGHLGYAGVVLMGVYAGLMELVSGWSTILKVFYVLLLILGAFGLGTGLMAATSIAPSAYTHRVSSVCSRLCTCLATFVFIVALACHMGNHGYIAGIVLGVLAVSYMVLVWIEGDPAAYGAYTSVWTATKDLWLRFKWSGQRGPILP